jgi:hypothetical protein
MTMSAQKFSRAVALILVFSLSSASSLASDPLTGKKSRGGSAAPSDEKARLAEERDLARAEAAELRNTISNLEARIAELEEKLNKVLAALEGQKQKGEATEKKVEEVVAKVSSAEAEIETTRASVEALQQETVTSPGKMSLYGVIVAGASFADSQLNISDIPLWAIADGTNLAPAPVGGQTPPATLRAGNVNETILTMRQSRFGFRTSLPKAGNWIPSAQVEIDFFGARPAAGQGAVFNQPRVRLGYITLEHASGWKLVAGQDWIIFAPVNPTSFAHFAIPEAASAGNPWMRLPQIRMEKSTKLSDGSTFLFQAGVLRAVSGTDSPAPGSLADLPTLSGERAVHPFYQTRLAFSRPGAAKKTLTVGLSGHYGRQRALPNTIDSWGVAFDYVLPLHAKLGLSGEIWTGSNLSAFQAGILQGASLVGTSFRKINASGGWTQLAIAPTTKWTLNFGYGQDDPRNRDLVAPSNRAKNQLLWSNLMYKLHPNVTLALEYNYFDTIFRVPRTNPARVGTANYFNLSFVYSFQ